MTTIHEESRTTAKHPVSKTADQLQAHMYGSYRTMRGALCIIGGSLPLVLWAAGRWLFKVPLQDSMSAYYFAGDGAPMRTWFVGALWAIGVLLLTYKGFTDGEDRWLDIAGILVTGVALFPMEWPGNEAVHVPVFGTIHNACATVFFATIIFVCWKWGRATVHIIPDEQSRRFWNRTYKTVAWMFLIPGLLFASQFVFQDFHTRVFWTEATGIWVFSLYWFLKTIEIEKSEADKKAAQRRLVVQKPAGKNLAALLEPPQVSEVQAMPDRS